MLGMLFRYWSYRRWVFLAFEPEVALHPGSAALELAPQPVTLNGSNVAASAQGKVRPGR